MNEQLRWWTELYDPDVDDAPPGDDTDCDGTSESSDVEDQPDG